MDHERGVILLSERPVSGRYGAPQTLASFSGANGALPEFGLIMDKAGDLFGTTFSGGGAGDGTVFEIAKTAGG